MLSILRAATAALLLTLGQPASQQFVGTWTSEYGGRTLARLELQAADGTLTGRISIGAFHVDTEGNLDQVSTEATNFTPIFDVVVRDGVLSFARKDEDDTDRFELRFSGDTARLTFLIADKFREELKALGVAAPKPITFRRIER